MGNRANIASVERDFSVYVHWNGGRDSVEGFLGTCVACGYTPPTESPNGWARLCQVVGNFFGAGGLSVGISRYAGDAVESDEDNGLYLLDGWEIAGRGLPYDGYEEQREHDSRAMAAELAAEQPERAAARPVSGERCAVLCARSRAGVAVLLPAEAAGIVPALIAWCKLAGFRCPADDEYGWARLLQTACNALDARGMGDCVEVASPDAAAELAALSFSIADGWACWRDGAEVAEPSAEELLSVDRAQPERCRLGGYVTAEAVPVRDVRPGDLVYLARYGEPPAPVPVVGTVPFWHVVNGTQCQGLPYVGAYYMKGDASGREGYIWNANNFLTSQTVRRVPRSENPAFRR